MIWIDRAIAWFWARVSSSCAPSTEGLAFLRILTGLFLLLILAPYSYWVGTAPPAFFNPPKLSPMALASAFPSTQVMWLADITALMLSCCVLLGIRARVASLLLVVVGVVSSNATMCFGKIDHDAMQWTFLACMAFSGWGRNLALVPDKPSRFDAPQRAFALMAVCLAFGMSVIGIFKARGWVDFNLQTNGFLSWFMQGYFVDKRTALLARYVPSIPPLGLELMDYSGVLFEAGCLPALLAGPRVWRFWVMAACVFHLTNILTLNIPFLQNVPIYLAFVDFSGVQRKLERWRQERNARIAFVGLGVSMVLAHLVLRIVGVGRWLFFVLDEADHNPLVLRISAVLYVMALWAVADDQARRWRAPRGAPTAPVAEG